MSKRGNKKNRNLLQRQLKQLKEEFEFRGYTQKQIQFIELQNNASTLSDFIENLKTEKSYWNN